MIERKFVSQKIKEFKIQEHVMKTLRKAGISHVKLKRTPLGDKIVIYTSRPGLVVGRKGQSIKKLTSKLKNEFKLENPEVDISDVEDLNYNAQIVAERIASSLERFGASKFKGIGHKTMKDAMDAGALGIEILMSGKIPGARAKTWRFYQGYLKKCGEISLVGVNKAYAKAQLKTGTIGIQVRIMPPTTKLPDDVTILEETEVTEENAADKK